MGYRGKLQEKAQVGCLSDWDLLVAGTPAPQWSTAASRSIAASWDS